MITGSNYFEKRMYETTDESSAKRVGSRIRKIREENKLSMAELGERVGLNADRIQKYENGAAKPRPELLKTIASALNVSTYSLEDPVVSNVVGVMYALFEMDDIYNLRISRHGDSVSFEFGDGISGPLNNYLKEWNRVRNYYTNKFFSANSDTERLQVMHDYLMWTWNFPPKTDEQNNDLMKQEKKEQIQEMIRQLQQELANLE